MCREIVGLLMGILLCGCVTKEPEPTRYLREGVNRLTQQEITAALGVPYERFDLPDGGTTWHYHEYPSIHPGGAHSSSQLSPRPRCGELVLRFDQSGILREWKKSWETICDE